MAVKVEQAWEASDLQVDVTDGDKSTASLKYIVSGVTEESAAVSAAKDAAPASFQGIPRKSVSVDERLTQDAWKVNVDYANEEEDSGGSSEAEEDNYAFDISTVTKHISYGIETVGKYPSDAEPAMAGINDGEGADIVMPESRFSETHYISKSRCNASYRKRVAKLVGTVNSGSFRGYGKGEVLFLGCNGSRTGSSKWQVTFNFATAVAESNVKIGDISGIKKDPWDLVWVRTTEDTNSDETKVVKKAEAVFVERVYREGNFGELGI